MQKWCQKKLMGNNGLIDPIPCFSLACCFSRPAKGPAAAPVAYKIQHYCNYSVQKGITGFIDSRAGYCGRLPVSALFRCSPAANAGARQLYWRRPNQPMLTAPAKARREARSMRQARLLRPKQLKTLKLEVLNFPLTWIEAQSARQGPKQARTLFAKLKILVKFLHWADFN